MSDHTIDFKVVGSLDEFFFSEKFLAFAMGPVGSTKTTAGIGKILYHASRMAACTDGVRRSRAVFVRNTREQLRDTSLPDFLKWFPDGVLGNFARTDNRFTMRMGDIECEVLFRGLDDANDVRRLLSLQASFGIMDEVREINPQVFEALQGRLGRYPDGMMVPHRPEWGNDAKGNPIQGCVTDEGKPNDHLWGMTNSPDYDTYWEQLFSNPPENCHVTIQPSGLSQEADWIHMLKSGYYENLIKGKTQDWIDIYVNAQFGKSLSGQPVFRSFNRDFHVAKTPLNVSNSSDTPLLIGFDCGLTPAATIGKVFYDGRLLIHHSLTSSGMGALRFVREKLKPVLATRFPGQSAIVIIDPAGFQRAQTDERCVADILKNEGFKVIPAKTNSITARLSAVDSYLTRNIDTKALIQFDPVHCEDLVRAMAGKYRYKVKAVSGDVDDKPAKEHPWSDVADSLQYLCLHADNGSLMGHVNTVAQPVKKAPYRWAV